MNSCAFIRFFSGTFCVSKITPPKEVAPVHVAVRSSLTAGVALVGAGAMAVSPVSPAAPQMLTPTMQSVAVDLTAATNPVTAWTKVLTDAFGNTARIGGALVSDPAPVLRQVITNDVGYVTSVATGLASTIQGLIASATSSEPGSLGAALQTLIDDIEAGEYHQAGLDAGNLMFGVLMSAFGLISALEIPVTITQNIANATVAAVGGLVTGAVLPAVGTLQGAFVAAGDSAQAVADALGDGDIADAVLNLVNTPATLTGALLNGYTYDFGGSPTSSWGFLSYDPATFTAGLVPGLLVNLPRAIRDAIKPAPALAKLTGDTVTLDVAAEPSAEKASAPTELTKSEESPAADDPAPARQLVRHRAVATPDQASATGTPTGAKQAQEAVKKVATSVSDQVDTTVSKLKKGFKNGFAKPAKHAKPAKADKADNSSGDAGGGDGAS